MQPQNPSTEQAGVQPLQPAAPAPAMPNAQSNQSNSNNNPQSAEDNDRIEKAWVTKVKHVMSTTLHDPYEQNKQFMLLKADYMQKRYGKIIKSEE
jgi:hypothetical protein